jgi:HNH endonuclease
VSRHVQASAPHHPKASSSGCVYEHIIVAERALGRHLPPSAQVHHVDGNPRNNVPSNLVICQDMAYHKLLHYRAKVMRAGGNPNTDKVCCDCRRAKPLDAFNVMRRNLSSGRQSVCRECAKLRDARKRAMRAA